MRRSIFVLFITSLGMLLAACGSSNAAQATPTGAPVTIALVTIPSPPAAGEVTLQFTVTDPGGQPISGADFDVIADHTDMGGMTLHGKATEQQDGLYTISANFEMAGNWKVTVQVRKDSLDYKQDIDLKVK